MATTDHFGADAGNRCEEGTALVLVLLLGVLLLAVGTAVALVADIETMVTANHRDVARVRYAAEAAGEVVLQELIPLADWTVVLNGTRSSAMSGPFVLPPLAGRTPVDAPAATAMIQQDSYGGSPWGADTPRWRLFAHGVPGLDLPFAGLPDDMFALVWVSDDIAESDGDPFVDSNDVLVVRARAMGVRGSQADVQMVIARVAPGIVRRVSSRFIR
jgi:hypothetical protein